MGQRGEGRRKKAAAKPSEKPDENSSRAGTQRKGRLERAVECGIRTRRDGVSGGDPFCENIRGADRGRQWQCVAPSLHPSIRLTSSPPQRTFLSSLLLLSSIWGTKSGGRESEKGRRQRLQPPPPPLRSALSSFLPLSSNLHQCRCQWKKTEVELRPTPLLLSFSR